MNQAASFQKNIIKKGYTAEDVDLGVILSVQRTHTNLTQAIAIHCQHSSFAHIGKGIVGSITLPYNGNEYPLGKESKPFLDRYADYKHAEDTVKWNRKNIERKKYCVCWVI